MGSDLFAGRVNHVYRGVYKDTTDQFVDKTMAMRLMPCCNSVSIPGPKMVILVLVDCTATSNPGSVQFGEHLNVPIFLDRAHVVAQTFADPWNHWYCNDNIASVTADAQHAFHYSDTHLSVENTSSIALSVIAELYGALYNGVSIIPSANTPTYNWQESAGGAWSMYENNTIATGSRLRTEFWDDNPAAEVQARRRMVGYNSSSISPWHLPPTGMTLTDRDDISIFHGTGHIIKWSADDCQTRICPNYTIPSMESRVRIATAMELIAVHETRCKTTIRTV